MVYVDFLIDYGWKLGASCHMMADTENELHELAAIIGLKRSWFQDKDNHSINHYDLTVNKRRLAIKAGAHEITTREEFKEVYDRLRKQKPINK